MKKRSLFLFGILSLGWLQPFCTAVATTETSPQNYPAVTNNSLRDSMLFTVNSQPTSSKPTSGSITQESNSEKGTSPTVSSTKAANEETMPGSDNAESTSTANKKTASLTTSSTKHSAKEETSKKGAATEKTVKNGAVTSGTWGTAPYKWDASSGTLTVSAGDLQDTDKAPWKLSSPVMQASDIQIINFEGSVMAPVNSSELFSRLSNLEKINSLSLLNTSSVTDMSSMFKSDSRLTDLDLSHFDTSKVQNMNCMFNVIGTSKLDLSSFVTSNVKDMGWMFADSTALESVIFPSTFTTDQVRDMTGMFRWTAITTLDISTFNNNLVPVDGMSSMFKNMTKLKSLTLGKYFSFKTIDTGLPDPPNDKNFGGKWRNVSSGTPQNPLGKNLWTADEFMKNYNGSSDEDTYVWQPKGMYINEVTDTFSFPKVQLSGNKQTVTPTGNAHLTLTDALPKNDTGTQLLVSYETPDDAWQKAGLSLKITPTTTQTYVKTTEVLVSSDPAPIITQFDESEKQAATFVDLDLAPELTVPPASAALVPKDYSTTIDWTIQQGPK